MERSTTEDSEPQKHHPSKLLESYNHDGFVILPSLLTTSELSNLRSAAQETISLARTHTWPHVRTLPKQFPPWPSPAPPGTGIWGVQHLLHPSLPSSPIFAQNYFSTATLNPVKSLLQCTDDDLVMELFNLLIKPDQDFALRWHRDDIPPTATPEEEMERLRRPAWHAQWNLALSGDTSLLVIPGSHLRPRTPAERAADPLMQWEGEQVVRLRAGDAVFYNNNILHRGVYDAGVERATLHGSVGHVRGGGLRARNVLQHGVGGWVGGVDFSVLEEEGARRAEGMRERLVELGKSAGWEEEVGFSLEG